MAYVFFHLLILLVSPSAFCAMEHGDIVNITTINQLVNLTCHLNSSQNVEWSVYSGDEFLTIFSCTGNQCSRMNGRFSVDSKFRVHQVETTSNFSFSRSQRVEEICRCKSGSDIIQTYNVRFFDLSDITSPYCKVSPKIQSGSMLIKLECGFDLFSASLAFEGVGGEIQEVHRSSHRIEGIIDQSTFLNAQNASCKFSIPGTPLNRSCTYPTAVHIRQSVEEYSMIIQCEAESDVEVSWRFLDTEGMPEDITNRSWTRDGGWSFLIQRIDLGDVGKVIECRIYRQGNRSTVDAIGFAVVPALNRGEPDCTGAWPYAISFNLVLIVGTVCVTVILLFGAYLIYRYKSGRSRTYKSRESSKSKSLKTSPAGKTTSSKENVVRALTDPYSKETRLLGSLDSPVFDDKRPDRLDDQIEYDVMPDGSIPLSPENLNPISTTRNDLVVDTTQPLNSLSDGKSQRCWQKPVIPESKCLGMATSAYQAQTEYEVMSSEIVLSSNEDSIPRSPPGNARRVDDTRPPGSTKTRVLLEGNSQRGRCKPAIPEPKFVSIETSSYPLQTEYEVMSSEIVPSSNEDSIPRSTTENARRVGDTRPPGLMKTRVLPEGKSQRGRCKPAIPEPKFVSIETSSYPLQTEYEVMPSPTCKVASTSKENTLLSSTSKNDHKEGAILNHHLEATRSAVQPEDRSDQHRNAFPDNDYIETDGSQEPTYANVPRRT